MVVRDTLTYTWALINKPGTSSNPLGVIGNSVNTTFTPDPSVSSCVPYEIELDVSDGKDSDLDYVIFCALNNQDPVADAGNDTTINVTDWTTIDGSGSFDSDGSIVNCEFTFEDNGQVYTETAPDAQDGDGLFDCKVIHYFNTQNTNCRDPPTCSKYGWKVDLQVRDDDNSISNMDTTHIRVLP